MEATEFQKWSRSQLLLLAHPDFMSRLDPVQQTEWLRRFYTKPPKTVTPGSWGKLVQEELSQVLKDLSSNGGMAAESEFLHIPKVVALASNEALAQVISNFVAKALRHDPKIAVRFFSNPELRARVSPEQLARLLKWAISTHSWTARQMLSESQAIDRLDERTLESLVAFIVAYPDRLEETGFGCLKQEHFLKRLGGSKYASLLSSAIKNSHDKDYEVFDYLNDNNILLKLQESDFYLRAITQSIAENRIHDSYFMKRFLQTRFGNAVLDRQFMAGYEHSSPSRFLSSAQFQANKLTGEKGRVTWRIDNAVLPSVVTRSGRLPAIQNSQRLRTIPARISRMSHVVNVPRVHFK